MGVLELISQLFLCFIFGTIAALFAVVFDFCLQEGKLLDWYYDLISKIKSKHLFNWLGGCTICFSFTFITIPIVVFKYLNYQISGFVNILFLTFIQYSITFVLLYVYFWAEEIVKLHKTKLEYDTQRADILRNNALRRSEERNNTDASNKQPCDTTLKTEEGRAGGKTTEEVSDFQMF